MDGAGPPPDAGQAPQTRGRLRAAWRHRRWRLLLASITIGTVADFVAMVALVVALMEQTGSATWVATLWIARLVASTLLGPVAGAAVDRVERQRLMAVTELGRALAMGSLAILVVTGAGPVAIVVAATVFSTLGAVYLPASVSATPTLVPEDDLAAANAANATVYQLGWFAGPALGTALVALGGTGLAFAVNAAGFVVSAFLVTRVGRLGPGGGGSRPGDAATPRRRAGELAASLTEGAAEVRSHTDLLALTVFVVATMLAFGIEQVVQVLVVTDRLGWDADGVGLLNAFIGAGGLMAAPFAARFASGRSAGRLLAGSGVAMGAALGLLAVTSTPAVAFGLSVLEGVGNVVFDVVFITLLQRACRAALLGRVYALQESAGSTAQLAGTVLAPVLVGVGSLELALVVGGGGLVLASVLLLPSLHAVSVRAQAEMLRLAPVVGRLRALGLFDDAGTAQLERVARGVRPVDVAAGDFVFHEGDPPDDLYVIDGGQVSVLSEATGEVRRLGPGDWFGEIGLIRDVPRTMSIRASEDTSLLAIPGPVFVDAIAGRGALPDPMCRAMNARLARTHPSMLAVGGPE